jgi:cation transport regulator ChaB
MNFRSDSLLRTVDFRCNTQAVLGLKEGDMMHINRDFAYHLHENPDGSFTFDLTVYIIHQLSATHQILVSYVGLEKWLIYNDGATRAEDMQALTGRISIAHKAAWNYVSYKEPNLQVRLKSDLKTEELSRQIQSSLCDIGFYN